MTGDRRNPHPMRKQVKRKKTNPQIYQFIHLKFVFFSPETLSFGLVTCGKTRRPQEESGKWELITESHNPQGRSSVLCQVVSSLSQRPRRPARADPWSFWQSVCASSRLDSGVRVRFSRRFTAVDIHTSVICRSSESLREGGQTSALFLRSQGETVSLLLT